MIRRPPRSTLSSSSAASDVYKRQQKHGQQQRWTHHSLSVFWRKSVTPANFVYRGYPAHSGGYCWVCTTPAPHIQPVSYTHLRAHETPEHLVCRLLLEKKNNNKPYS
eukprot:TRINITY_DN13110_c0_g2_i1.p2 TRINITY_DN13110_c0_g2~~TRINITY_DN13110_c0_g2_i1.p2  ORF type:complete len:107 (-),score=19.58 TRINITY_DN13110_c0_g2_i1:30-350(-)